MPDDLPSVVNACHHEPQWACISCIRDAITQVRLTRYRTKDGRPIHDGDCHFWSWSICTCGLLHWLAPMLPEETWYAEERARQERAFQVKKYPPIAYD